MTDSEMIDELTRLHDDGLPSHRYYELIGLHLPCILALARRAVELEAGVETWKRALRAMTGDAEALEAENARLREHLALVITKDTTLVGYARQPYVGPCGQIARAALATPQDGVLDGRTHDGKGGGE